MNLINCLGIKINDYILPPFELDKGEYLTLSVPYLFNSKADKEISNVITSENKEDNNLIIHDNIKTVKDAIGSVSIWKKIFFNKAIKPYLQMKYNLSEIQVEELLSKNNLYGSDRIFSLGANQRKIISIQIAMLNNKHLIIDTLGMDYSGIDTLYKILEDREKGITIIELRYPSSNNFSIFPNCNLLTIR